MTGTRLPPFTAAQPVTYPLGVTKRRRRRPSWVVLALAVPLLIYGLLYGRRPDTPPRHGGWPYHLVAMAAFGAAAAMALGVTATVGAYFVAGGLLAHAVWDAYHYRINKVVARSLAEFCLVLDTIVAAVIVIVTATD